MSSTTSAPARGGVDAPAARGRRRRKRQFGGWWPFILPAFVLVTGFFTVPFLLNLRFAFTNWSGYSDVISFNGLENYRGLIDQNILWPAVRVTLLYAVAAMLIQNVFSLSMALVLQRSNRVNGFFRSFFFLPVLVAPVAAGYIWGAILAPSGPLNQAISIVRPGFDYAWLGGDTSALLSLAFVDAWKWSGLITLVYIAGLNNIPGELLEAATIDGANAWQRFWRIRFRLLAPAFTFTVVVTMLGAINAFDLVAATTRGGPGNATTVLNIALFNQYGSGFFGMASSLSLVVTILVVALGLPLIAYLRRREVEA
ncbi:carbohydrate ABC transporter permease [Cryptosporangium aurantiacum]|uniref:Carbohydrate ABC transporter membrane protein 1, CUT1 family n=1 Tax=Cryptosporangium aurantiacum TaxID=134849 RepID=A0A1M7PE25_9ACTN|nr:sugar ABC transporter permease [Cryptosporangium aurantiacum]SHN14803.1 carbohydrate ABC transporter membrane protein 1, CUT1 family [Cryptosporangium aurantiacum]